MKTLTAALAVVLLVGCGGGAGPAGPQGPAGTPGATGGTGTSEKQLVWVDAHGTMLSGETLLAYIDARGLLWGMNSDTGAFTNGVKRQLLYTSAGCAGPAYVVPDLPRSPFKVAGETQWRVRADAQGSASQIVLSVTQDGTTCLPTSFTANAIPVDSTSIPSPMVADPVIPYTAPFHLELR